MIAAGNDRLFRTLCSELGCPELASRPEFASNPARSENEAQLKPLLERALGARPTREWLERLGRAGVPCGPINDVADVLADPQVLARNMIVSATRPDGSRLRMAGNPVKLSAFPDASTREPAPALDADRDSILAWLREGAGDA